MQHKVPTSPYGMDHLKVTRHHKLTQKYFLLEADVGDFTCSNAQWHPKNSESLIAITSLHLSIEVLMEAQFYFVGWNNFDRTTETDRVTGREDSTKMEGKCD
jgi:hypothetical protein